MIARKVEDLLAGWAPQQERAAEAPAAAGKQAPPGSAPRTGRRALHRVAAALLVVFGLLRVLAPTPVAARAAAPRANAPALTTSSALSLTSARPVHSTDQMKLVLAQRSAARRGPEGKR